MPGCTEIVYRKIIEFEVHMYGMEKIAINESSNQEVRKNNNKHEAKRRGS